MNKLHHKAGSFKKNDNEIMGANFKSTPVHLVLSEWAEELNYELENVKSNNQLFSVVANYHVKFEKIHPIADGNGRIGRLLINKILLDFNMSPIVILNKEKSIYYECLSTENIDKFIKLVDDLVKVEHEKEKLFENKVSKV